MKSSNTNDSNKKRKTAIRLLLVLISFTAIVISYFDMAVNVRNIHRRYINVAYDDAFSTIRSYIETLYKEANQHTAVIAKDIEEDITDSYPDLTVLKDLMDNNDYDSLIDIISDKISNEYYGIHNQRNNIFVATNKYILYDYNYMYTSNSNSNNKYNTWQQYLEKDYNKDLSENSFSQIYNYPDEMVFIEPYESKVKNHVYYSNINMDILKEVFINEGLEGLKGYELLVPAYIYEAKDIFDQQEIVKGVRQDTHRLIVVQRINIYDQIKANLKMNISESYINRLKTNTTSILTSIYLVGMIIIIGGCILLAHVCALFNNQFILPMEEVKDQSTK